MLEIGDLKLLKAWSVIQELLGRKEVLQIFDKMQEMKDELLRMLELAQKHKSTLKKLTDAY